MKKRRIGLLGGSFDPIHIGHLNLCIELKERCHLDEVWLIPSKISPFKQDKLATGSDHRLKMMQLAIENLPNFIILDIELKREGLSYTVDTLKELLRDNDKEFFLMIGDDILDRFHEWKEAEEIAKSVPLLIGRRKDTPISPQGNDLIRKALMKGRQEIFSMDISSTRVRERLAQGLYCGHLVPDKVLDYILTHHLYERIS